MLLNVLEHLRDPFATLKLIKSKLLVASIIFYLIHIIGLIWTDDIKWGLHILHKMWYFILLFPILFSITKKEFVKFYIFSFILAMSLTEILSFLTTLVSTPKSPRK